MKKFFFIVLLIAFISACLYEARVLYLKNYLYPIDLVYTWVDGADKNWQEEKKYWQKKLNVTDQYAVSDARYRDREELLHSLRSVEEYLPWIRKIYIVTYKQVPVWLDVSNPKIKIIDHSEIFPKDAMPVFNSIAIENVIANISGLSEHFIYSNDDCFVNKPLPPQFFFNEKGQSILYTDPELNQSYNWQIKVSKNTIFSNVASFYRQVFQKKLKVSPLDMLYAYDTHNMQSYRKSAILKTSKIFKKELKPSIYSKFRSSSDINVLSLSYMYEYLNKKLDVRHVQKDMDKYNCKYAGILIMSHMHFMETKDPCLFCLNDFSGISKEKENIHRDYLRKRFTKKSSFEK